MLYMVSTPSLHTQESIKASLQCTINNIIIHIYIYNNYKVHVCNLHNWRGLQSCSRNFVMLDKSN